ncbi:MAG: hypothetical protein ABSH28_19980 [Acidobacteriota bacterium]
MPALIGVLMMLPSWSAGAQGIPPDQSRTFVSQIAPDLAIVTELSIGEPYVGQQFSIVYRLRAQQAPAAVDIDPQQYPGFWTEAIPISQQAASTPRPIQKGGPVDYLLRQVIAFPLMEGMLTLPPLSLRVKRYGSVSPAGSDWDVVGLSTPDPVHVISPPVAPLPGADLPFVGRIEGKMSLAGEGQPDFVLEVEGTANLSLFQPLDWLQPPPGLRFHARLAAAENVAQIVDREGKRQILLVQRQRWLIGFSGGESGQRIDDFFLPVFEPHEKAWKGLSITGLKLPDLSSTSQNSAASPHRGATETGICSRLFGSSGALVVLALAALAAILPLVLWLRAGRFRKDRGTDECLTALEKKLRTSPRAFLDKAHRVLAQYAETIQRSHNLGVEDTMLDRCWISVQRFRFDITPLSSEVCREILNSIRQIIKSKP